ncbi:MAG: phosphatidate cytidylyltransferase [Saprospiraceae bacterium]|nr:phosphatidate cytidylyltransferase [Saprospiraceae bacterium]
MPNHELRERVLTGAVLGGAVIGMLLGGETTTVLLVTLICLLSGRELYHLVVARHDGARDWIFAGALTLPLVLHFFYPLSPGSLGGAAVLFDWIAVLSLPVIAGLLALTTIRSAPERFFQRMVAMAMGVLMISVPGIFALQLAALTPLFLLGVFLLIWTSDTIAYFTGRRWGRTKLAPLLSPGKTVEGTVGGLVATLGVALLLSQWVGLFGWRDWLINAALVIIFGTLGDLTVSAIKRVSQHKDSGTLLPGHGGFLDRFDSFLGCLPWIGIYNLFI